VKKLVGCSPTKIKLTRKPTRFKFSQVYSNENTTMSVLTVPAVKTAGRGNIACKDLLEKIKFGEEDFLKNYSFGL
jgi:hypothetical protein